MADDGLAAGDLAARGLVLLGCGKMGSAMLAGWLSRGLPTRLVWVLDPAPSDWVRAQGVHVNEGLPEAPAVALIAVKPQMMGAALPGLQALGAGTLFVSVAAGTPIAAFEVGVRRRADRARHAQHARRGRSRHHGHHR